MKIREIDIDYIAIPLAVPFKTALRTVDRIEDVVVKITADTGEIGFGEAPPTAAITGETRDSIAGAIREYIRPAVLGSDVENLDGIMQRLHGCIQGNPSAKACVDMAVYDLYAKRFHAPLYQLLGGCSNELETDITISVNPVEEMVRDSLAAVGQGFHILKIKVGKEGDKDIERVGAIRQAVGRDVRIRVDANQGWRVKQAIRIIQTMESEGLDIELCEQPVSAHDLEGMREVTRSVSTLILADESVYNARDAMNLISNHSADLINIKLMKTGGIYGALQICSLAQAGGVDCMVGCMLESKLAVSAAAHLAAARHVVKYIDLDGPSLCKTDPFEGGPDFEGCHIRMNQLEGIGIRSVPAFR